MKNTDLEKMFSLSKGLALLLFSLLLTAIAHAQDDCPAAALQSCSIIAQDLPAFVAQGAAIIDVRSAPEFASAAPQGAMNLPLYSLKTKDYLSRQPILIVSSAIQRLEPLRKCMELRRYGFTDPRVLIGGFRQYLLSGYQIDGSMVDGGELARISVTDLFRELIYDDWLLIDTAPQGNKPQRIMHHTVQHLALTKDLRSFERRLLTMQQERLKAAPHLRIALWGSGKDSQIEEEALLRLPLISSQSSIFIVKGGQRAIQEYLNQNDAMLKQLEEQSRAPVCGS